jgi:HD-GYP domain-containing protein (c-di-GMP phosphodiesterase class II)
MVLPNGNWIVDISFTDFLTVLSLALDLRDPQNGRRGIRRAFIAMAFLREQGASLSEQQDVYIAALLYELGVKGAHNLSHCREAVSQISLLSNSASLIFEKSAQTTHSRLLDLVDNLDLLALYEFPSGKYPSSAIETLCDSIGSRYSLDDILTLRELEQCPEIWLKLASPSLLNDVRAQSPFLSQKLQQAELIQLAALVAMTVDQHCQYPDPRSVLVAKYSVCLAKMYGFSPTGIMEMRLAGLLHGLGKLALPSRIFTKADYAQEKNHQSFKSYPLATREILCGIPGMYQIAMIASRQHEQPDGKGFPDGLTGTQLDLSTRMISVARTYVSLRARNGGKTMLSPAATLSLMKMKATEGLLDLDIVNALEGVIYKMRSMEGVNDD